MNAEIFNRAYEMIANGFDFGQIERGDTWERLMAGGPYSDIYICAEKIEEEFGVNINVGLKYLKRAFEKYTQETDDELNESKNTVIMEKNVVKLNESTLRQIVAECVKNVLKEDGQKPFQIDINRFNQAVKQMAVQQGVQCNYNAILQVAQQVYKQGFSKYDYNYLIREWEDCGGIRAVAYAIRQANGNGEQTQTRQAIGGATGRPLGQPHQTSYI